MNKKERMKAMLEKGPIDYLPCQLDFVPYREKCLIQELKLSPAEFLEWTDNHFYCVFPLSEAEYYSSGSAEDFEKIVLAESRGLIQHDPDNQILFDSWGIGWKINTQGVWASVHPLAEPQSFDSYAFPNPEARGMFDHVGGEITAKSKEFYVVGLQHILLFERAWTLLGYENFMTLLSTDLKFVETLLDGITEYNVKLALRFVELGVDAVRTGDDYGCQLSLQMSPQVWRKLFKPRLANIWKVYHDAGVLVMHHSCGNVETIIPDMLEIGLQMLHPLQPFALSLLKIAQNFGDHLAFHGGIDTQKILPFGKPQEVKEAVRECIEILGRNRQYVIAPSQEIMNDVPTENIIALVEGIREYH
ncbi:MAG: hypothetical protein NTX88_02295 [Candidatus Atribacteria bacterium]|nr:hypothetical protein [Candidatus Atribacteria bacterium]